MYFSTTYIILGVDQSLFGLYLIDYYAIESNETTQNRIWNRVCVFSDQKNGNFFVYQNDKTIVKVFGQSTKIKKLRKNGYVFLGQEQDEFGGGFFKDQSFSGIISNLMLFNYELPEDQILKYIHCDSLDLGISKSFLDFNDLSNDWSFNGSVKVTEESLDKICQSNFRKTYLHYHDGMTFMQAYDVCKITTGKQ